MERLFVSYELANRGHYFSGLFSAGIVSFFRLQDYYKFLGIIPTAYGKQVYLLTPIWTPYSVCVAKNRINTVQKMLLLKLFAGAILKELKSYQPHY
jgi:hypothetical protein